MMISDPLGELLTTLRGYTPDLKKPLAHVREEFSVLYEGYQDAGSPETERVTIHDTVQGTWISLPESRGDRAVLFFHGGGFTLGSTRDHLGLCSGIARACRARVFSVDYRLAPEHVFPAAAEDALAAYQYLVAHGTSPHRIVPVGISAGGTLVLDLLIAAREARLPPPPAAVCLSPFTDLRFQGESVERNQGLDWLTPVWLNAIRTTYLSGSDPRDPRASPVCARLEGLPRLYIQAGTHELLLSDIAAFVDRARWAGVPVRFELWEGMFHCWQLFARDIPEGEQALDQIGAFVQDVLLR